MVGATLGATVPRLIPDVSLSAAGLASFYLATTIPHEAVGHTRQGSRRHDLLRPCRHAGAEEQRAWGSRLGLPGPSNV